MSDLMREEFEASPRFRGMDFTRSATHPDHYDSPYANGAWDGWKASRESMVVELPEMANTGLNSGGWPVDYGADRVNSVIKQCMRSIHAAGVRTK